MDGARALLRQERRAGRPRAGKPVRRAARHDAAHDGAGGGVHDPNGRVTGFRHEQLPGKRRAAAREQQRLRGLRRPARGERAGMQRRVAGEGEALLRHPCAGPPGAFPDCVPHGHFAGGQRRARLRLRAREGDRYVRGDGKGGGRPEQRQRASQLCLHLLTHFGLRGLRRRPGTRFGIDRDGSGGAESRRECGGVGGDAGGGHLPRQVVAQRRLRVDDGGARTVRRRFQCGSRLDIGANIRRRSVVVERSRAVGVRQPLVARFHVGRGDNVVCHSILRDGRTAAHSFFVRATPVESKNDVTKPLRKSDFTGKRVPLWYEVGVH